MRLLPILLILLPLPAGAEIRSMAECVAAIGTRPSVAREEAAQWATFGGGAEAKACEARALEALGAKTTAAVILTEVASDRGNGLPAATRAALLRDAGRLWLEEGQPAVAREALTRGLDIGPADPDALAMRGEASGRLGLWPDAVRDLTEALKLAPGRADILALRAAAKRKSRDPAGGLEDAEAALANLPHLEEALFEKGACLAVLGRIPEALDVWFRLIELHPESEMAELARRNIQQLSGN
ncbi:MAG TPA: tetratricopeptide repeat protein [Paracoccaceae bacterium]|nr:tetratricopeptide repeat protein [Paracoccaceae bacterium]